MSENSEFIKHYPPSSPFRAWAYEKWLSLGITRFLKTRRVRFMDQLWTVQSLRQAPSWKLVAAPDVIL